jgi:hypothetical protein
MSFAVSWSQESYHSLAELLRTETDAESILDAVEAIEEQLAEDPATKGESRSGGMRILVLPPLVALFQVRWRLNEVLIGKVWGYARKDRQ